jgi:hypothetical protein
MSRRESTALSIGCIIIGIENNPRAVGSHLDTNKGSPIVLATAILEE